MGGLPHFILASFELARPRRIRLAEADEQIHTIKEWAFLGWKLEGLLGSNPPSLPNGRRREAACRPPAGEQSVDALIRVDGGTGAAYDQTKTRLAVFCTSLANTLPPYI